MLTIGTSGNIRVLVHESKIVGMHLPGGDVHRYAEHLADTTVRFAKINAPKRTWRLANSIRREIDMRGAARGRLVARVRADANYAAYVHEGTGPVIYPHGEWLMVPVAPYSARKRRRPFVRGQSANPFLEESLQEAMLAPYFPRP